MINTTQVAYWPRKSHMLIPNPTAAELHRLKAQYDLRDEDIAEMAVVHINTVRSWLSDRGTTTFRLMPPRHMAIIRHMLPGWIARRASVEKAEAEKAMKKAARKRPVAKG